MVDWRAVEAAVDNTMAKTFGETVRVSFLKNGVADSSRPLIDIRAVLHTGGDDSIQVGERGGGGVMRMRLSAGEAELFVDRSTYNGPTPIPGDKVRGTDRAGQPWWKIEAISDRYSNLMVLTLSQA